MSDDEAHTRPVRFPRPSELDPSVIHQAVFEGSAAAFVLLYRHHEGGVRHAVARAALTWGFRDDVDGLVQAVWCRFLDHDRRTLRHYDPSRGPFSRYIRWVAYQQAYYVIQRQRPRRALVDGSPFDDEAQADAAALGFLATQIQSDLLQKILAEVDAELTATDRVLLREHHLGERSLRELARELGTSEDALYQRNTRLKKKLERAAKRLLQRPPSPLLPPHVPPDTLVPLLVLALGATMIERQDEPSAETMTEGEQLTRALQD